MSQKELISRPVEIFCCVAEADRSFLEDLSKQLTVQQREGVITLWDKFQLQGGDIVDEEIQSHLDNARIFLLLISPAFLADDYCYQKVLKGAWERQRRNKAVKIIPVIVHPTNWQDVRELRSIQVLPQDGEPISRQSDKRLALWKVARGIDVVVEGLIEPPLVVIGSEPPVRPTPPEPGKTPTDQSHTIDLENISKVPPQILDKPAPVELKPKPHRPILKRPSFWTLVVGLLVLAAGVLWGTSSPTVPYISTPAGTTPLSTISMKNGDLYISAPEDPSTFYIAHCNDLSPHIDCTKFPSNTKLSFLARPEPDIVNSKVRDDTTGKDLQVSQAYVIEELEVSDVSSASRTTYTASDYDPSHDYYESRWWPIAVALIAAGLVIASLSVFAWRRKGGNSA